MRMSSVFRRIPRVLSPALLVAAFGLFVPLSSYAVTPDYTPFQKAFGATGTIEPDGVLHFDLVRGDLSIKVGAQAVNSAVGGYGYVNFKYLGDNKWYTNGSLPVQEAEAATVQDALSPHNMHITAVVNHLAFENPRLLWIHFEDQDQASTLTAQISAALALMHNPQKGVTAVSYPVSTIPGALFQDAFVEANGTVTELNGAVLLFSVPRDDIGSFALGGVPASATLNVAYNFYVQPLTGNNIAMFTDLSLKPDELQAMRSALASAGLDVNGMHDNYEDDTLRLINVNAFGVGDAGTIGDSLYNSMNTILNAVD
jgi:hypothetical protein